MKIQGGTLVALLALIMLGVAFVGYLFYRHGGGFECVDRIVAEVPSPDQSLIATRYERECGGSIATHVNLRSAKEAFTSAQADDVYAAAARPDVRLHWTGPRALVIEAANQRSALGERNRWRDVRITLH